MRIRLIFVLVVVAIGLFAAACARKCKNADDCQRMCECADEAKDRIVNCNVFFTCTATTEECSTELTSLSCDQICQDFAAPIDDDGNNLCGRRRCTGDDECTRELLCTVPASQDGTVPARSFDCTLPFRCDTGLGFCEIAGSLTDEQTCAQCPQP